MIDTKALRSRILDLAIQGKLTEQLPSDGTAEELYQQIQAEKQALIKEGKIKKEKPLPEISADEIPFEIPSNWKWVRLQEIAYLTSGSQYEEIDEGIPYVKVADMNLDSNLYEITTSTRFVSESNNGIIPISSIIFPKRGGAILTNKKRIVSITPVFIDSNTMAMTLFVSDMLLYTKCWFDSIDLGDLHTGTSIPQINNKDLYPLIIPLPPLAEQKRIVSRVEEIFHILDIIDAAQQQYSTDAESLKAKLITLGIQGRLTEQLQSDGTAEELYQQIQAEKQRLIKEGKIKKEKLLPEIEPEEAPFEIPRNWKWVRLGDITSKIASGNTPKGGIKGGAYVQTGNCFFREQNIYNDGIHYDGMVYISDELLNTRPNSTVLPNDILLNITGGSIGRCAIIPPDFGKGSINQHILIIRLINDNMLYYIHQIMCSPYIQKLIRSKAVGDKDGFSGGRCKATLIPLPPLAEQKRIADKLDEVLGAIG